MLCAAAGSCCQSLRAEVREETRKPPFPGVPMEPGVQIDRDDPVWIVHLDRPAVRNAVDGPTAHALARVFREFGADPEARVAVSRQLDALRRQAETEGVPA